MNDPFQGLLGDLLKMIGGSATGSTAWLDAARSLAHGVATDGKPEGNADPLERIGFEELGRVAELHVVEATGLPFDRPFELNPVGRGTYALRVLDAWSPTLARMVEAQRTAPGSPGPGSPGSSGPGGTAPGSSGPGGTGPGRSGPGSAGPGGSGPGSSGTGSQENPLEERPGGGLGGGFGGGFGGTLSEALGGLGEGFGGAFGGSDSFEGLIGKFATTMGPVLVGMQFGSAAGHLAQRALGQYALPLPWPTTSEILLVPENIAGFAEEWSLPAQEARLWACLHELTAHAVLSRPHVAERIKSLVDAITVEMVATQQGLADRIGDQAGDPETLQRILADPESLLADLLTPGQRRTSEDLVALTTTVAGYVDYITGRVASTLTGSASQLSEAWYRRRIEEGSAEQAAGALFGLDLGREQVDRGAAFVRGVVERAGEDGLARLWDDPRHLPTPAEVDAPGLWLERIDLPELAEPEGPEGPDPRRPGRQGTDPDEPGTPGA